MKEMGKAMMGTGEAEGENRAIRAAEAAISNPLLEDTSMSGARGLLINITGGDDLTLFEVDQAATRIGEEVAPDANIIFGSALDPSLQGKIRVSVVATGIDTPMDRSESRPYLVAVGDGLVPDDAVGFSLPGTSHTQTTIPPVALRDVTPHAPPMTESPGGAPQGEPSPHASEQQSEQHDQHYGQQHAHPERKASKQPPVIDLTPTEQTRQSPRPAPGASLFAEAPRAAAVSAPAMEPTGGSKPVSMFAKVTGLFRRGSGEPVAAPAQRAEPAMSEPHAEARYEPRPTVRPAMNEDQVSDVPAFLRRQTS
jgi:cell division protein FtsZ